MVPKFQTFFKIILQQHDVWKLQKKSLSTLRAKRATFTFWVDKKKFIKMPKMVQFGGLLKTWSLRLNRVTRHVTFNRTKIGGKCPNSSATFWVNFKHCEQQNYSSLKLFWVVRYLWQKPMVLLPKWFQAEFWALSSRENYSCTCWMTKWYKVQWGNLLTTTVGVFISW